MICPIIIRCTIFALTRRRLRSKPVESAGSSARRGKLHVPDLNPSFNRY